MPVASEYLGEVLQLGLALWIILDVYEEVVIWTHDLLLQTLESKELVIETLEDMIRDLE